MLAAALPYLVDALVIAGVLLTTVGIYGTVRLTDPYLKVHAAGLGVLFGILPLLAAAALSGERDIGLRAALIAGILLLTAPISGHAVAKAIYRADGERQDDAS